MPRFSLFILLLACLAPVAAQAEDPCLETLAGSPELLARYDALVGAYVQAEQAGSPAVRLETLKELRGLCDANLRLRAMQAEALSDAGRCQEAAALYDEVERALDGWPHPENARDASEMVGASRPRFHAGCDAHLDLQCQDEGAQVTLPDGTQHPCPVTLQLVAGTLEVVVSAPAKESAQRTLELAAGRNVYGFARLDDLPNGGVVTFTCAQQGVELELEGRKEPCPLQLRRPAGSLVFAATSPNGGVFQGSVNVVEGSTVQVLVPVLSGQGEPEPPPREEPSTSGLGYVKGRYSYVPDGAAVGGFSHLFSGHLLAQGGGQGMGGSLRLGAGSTSNGDFYFDYAIGLGLNVIATNDLAFNLSAAFGGDLVYERLRFAMTLPIELSSLVRVGSAGILQLSWSETVVLDTSGSPSRSGRASLAMVGDEMALDALFVLERDVIGAPLAFGLTFRQLMDTSMISFSIGWASARIWLAPDPAPAEPVEP